MQVDAEPDAEERPRPRAGVDDRGDEDGGRTGEDAAPAQGVGRGREAPAHGERLAAVRLEDGGPSVRATRLSRPSGPDREEVYTAGR
jgi:hypothetical protein